MFFWIMRSMNGKIFIRIQFWYPDCIFCFQTSLFFTSLFQNLLNFDESMQTPVFTSLYTTLLHPPLCLILPTSACIVVIMSCMSSTENFCFLFVFCMLFTPSPSSICLFVYALYWLAAARVYWWLYLLVYSKDSTCACTVQFWTCRWCVLTGACAYWCVYLLVYSKDKLWVSAVQFLIV